MVWLVHHNHAITNVCFQKGISAFQSLAWATLGVYFLYMVTTAAPPIPKLCWSATHAPSTCLFSLSPRNCDTSSAHWANPTIHKIYIWHKHSKSDIWHKHSKSDIWHKHSKSDIWHKHSKFIYMTQTLKIWHYIKTRGPSWPWSCSPVYRPP
jgi:hypothetical protein